MAMTETTESAVARHHIRTTLTHPRQGTNEYHLVAHLASKLPPHYPSTAGNSTALIERQDSNTSSSTADDTAEAARRAVAFQGTLLESYARPRTAPGTNGTSTPASARAVTFKDTDGEEEEEGEEEDSGKSKRPNSQLQRSRSDFGPRAQDAAKVSNNRVDEEGTWRMRHGWEDQYSSEEYLSLLTSVSIIADEPLESSNEGVVVWSLDLLTRGVVRHFICITPISAMKLVAIPKMKARPFPYRNGA
jgi:hypothetical protein